MVDTSLPLAMNNPPFPAYVSGHSTVSAAAAEILSAIVPSKSLVWNEDAANARDSRLYAGIHFPADNRAGFDLGRRVGSAVVKRLKLRSLETAP
jgi:membrane-associated phospholipid phosphatase